MILVDELDVFVKIANLKVNIRNMLEELKFDKLNNVSYIKDISNDRRFVVAFEENQVEIWLYDKKTDTQYKEVINYEAMLKDMIFYDLTVEYIIKTILEELRIYG